MTPLPYPAAQSLQPSPLKPQLYTTPKNLTNFSLLILEKLKKNIVEYQLCTNLHFLIIKILLNNEYKLNQAIVHQEKRPTPIYNSGRE